MPRKSVGFKKPGSLIRNRHHLVRVQQRLEIEIILIEPGEKPREIGSGNQSFWGSMPRRPRNGKGRTGWGVGWKGPGCPSQFRGPGR